MHQYGRGTFQDYVLARQHYLKAVQAEIAEAELNLGFLYYYGLGVPVNPSVAFEYFKIASKKDLPQAHYHLGLIYKDGNGVQKDDLVANQWFKRASSLGVIEAASMVKQISMRESKVKIESEIARKGTAS
jgi:TPR repeat protein